MAKSYQSPSARNKRQGKNLSQNWGSTFLRTKISREPYLLQKRTLQDLKYWEWMFIIVSTVGILINFGFNLYQLIMALIHKERYLFPIFLCVYNVFAIYFLFVGILKELPFQILMQLVTRFIIWVFNMIYFLTPKDKDEIDDVTEEEVKAIRFYISSSMLFITIPVGGFVLYQYWTSNFALFKEVGTEPKYVTMCRTLFLGQTLIVLDLEISMAALLLVASTGLSEQDLASLVMLPVGFLYVVLWGATGHFAMKKESRYLTFFFYIMSHLQPVYVIYLLVRSRKSAVGSLLFYSTIVVAVLFFFIHIALLVTVVIVQLNYDKGLKQAAAKEIARTKSLAQSLNVIDDRVVQSGSAMIHTDV